jgi:hypothetical protein
MSAATPDRRSLRDPGDADRQRRAAMTDESTAGTAPLLPVRGRSEPPGGHLPVWTLTVRSRAVHSQPNAAGHENYCGWVGWQGVTPITSPRATTRQPSVSSSTASCAACPGAVMWWVHCSWPYLPRVQPSRRRASPRLRLLARFDRRDVASGVSRCARPVPSSTISTGRSHRHRTIPLRTVPLLCLSMVASRDLGSRIAGPSPRVIMAGRCGIYQFAIRHCDGPMSANNLPPSPRRCRLCPIITHHCLLITCRYHPRHQ